MNIPPPLSLGSKYVQVSYIVSDIEQAALKWSSTFGAGPFFVKQYATVEETLYQGEPADLSHISAYGQFGSIMLELIQPTGNGPSVYLDHCGSGSEGLHHFAMICPNVFESVKIAETLGYKMACRSGSEKTPVVFVDARHELGHMIELCQDGPGIRFLYDFIAKSAEGWQGDNPIRPFPTSSS